MSHYANGAAFERECVKELNRRGYWAHRSPGSKGTVDVFALHVTEPMLFVQCKTSGHLSAADAAKLRALARLYAAVPLLCRRGGPAGRGLRFYMLWDGAMVPW